ncbi:shikimate kinase [Demequina sp. TTPB684]|uniref:shikimate kinase n=1 Tax=unclassified Demequina TaxID=2620311 RepID=UPI001CF1B943|nr:MULTISPECIES: shikimate kinase [unclassified Demequina]MCB2411675.1 shikimate kinase [Demequina sp. TTPB684]UPU89245.1 shikimate kinase [Demequina sp. TMPB413]
MPPVVVLIGPPGSGKSSVGAQVARLLSTTLRDTDADVEAHAGRSVADIFVTDGEQHFRELERAAVSRALTEHEGVLSLGGGAPIDPATQDLLRAYVAEGGHVVFLDVSLTAAVPRVGLNANRPLLLGNPRQKWLALMTERRPIYEGLATRTVMTDDRKPKGIAREIAEALG